MASHEPLSFVILTVVASSTYDIRKINQSDAH